MTDTTHNDRIIALVSEWIRRKCWATDPRYDEVQGLIDFLRDRNVVVLDALYRGEGGSSMIGLVHYTRVLQERNALEAENAGLREQVTQLKQERTDDRIDPPQIDEPADTTPLTLGRDPDATGLAEPS